VTDSTVLHYVLVTSTVSIIVVPYSTVRTVSIIVVPVQSVRTVSVCRRKRGARDREDSIFETTNGFSVARNEFEI
jgi:hypothetical protein